MKGKQLAALALLSVLLIGGTTACFGTASNLNDGADSNYTNEENQENSGSGENSSFEEVGMGGSAGDNNFETEGEGNPAPPTNEIENENPPTNEIEVETPPPTNEAEPPQQPEQKPQQPQQPQQPEEMQMVNYIKITATGVNVRAGAGTNYKSLGRAEVNTLYANLGKTDGWYKTYYKNSVAYISAKYCTVVQMERSADALIENVIAEGTKLLGTKYVYGATRLHDGKGNKCKDFTLSQFDCSSLMQYIFYKGANVLLNVNTRTQIYQGTTVKKSLLKRGDLLFFTNSSRKNLSGIERVGHVAIYLGDNLILHTASDYAKIENISSLRWSYYIQAQRII